MMTEYNKDVSEKFKLSKGVANDDQSEKNDTGSDLCTPVTDPLPSIDPKVEKKLLRKIDAYVISLLGVCHLPAL
jgi:hypothetical protein